MTQSTARSTIFRLSTGLHELHLQGRFYHPHWLAFLLSGLSQLKVSVVSGKATRSEQQEWEAILQLDFRGSSAIPDQVDFGALTQKAIALDASPIQLSGFQVSRRPDKSLQVHLQGPDQLGFVGRFLTRVSLLGLYPTEVKILTSAGHISDTITLNGLGSAPPSAAQQESLDEMLRGLQSKPG